MARADVAALGPTPHGAMSKARHFAIACGLVAALSTPIAHAADDAMISVAKRLRESNPSILTEDDVRRARDAVREARGRIEWLRYDREVACGDAFFAASCTTEARRRQREALKEVRAVEIEADRAERKLRDDAREARREREQRDAESDRAASAREREQADFERRTRDAQRRTADGERRDATAATTAPREARQREQRAADRERRALEAQTRESRAGVEAAAYARKQRDAQARRAEVARREKERAARGAGTTPSNATKSGGDPAASGGPTPPRDGPPISPSPPSTR